MDSATPSRSITTEGFLPSQYLDMVPKRWGRDRISVKERDPVLSQDKILFKD